MPSPSRGRPVKAQVLDPARTARYVRGLRDQIQQLKDDNVRLAQTLRRVRVVARGKQTISPMATVFPDDVAGRTALGSYRREIGRLLGAVNNVGDAALTFSPSDARYVLRTAIRADLNISHVAASLTTEEAERAAAIDFLVSDEASATVLSEGTPEAEFALQELQAAIAGPHLSQASQEIMRRSGESFRGGRREMPADAE